METKRGGGSASRAQAAAGESRRRRNKCRPKPLGMGYMRPPRGHRTLFMWHWTRPVTTGLMRREVFKSAYHRTMATGRWP